MGDGNGSGNFQPLNCLRELVRDVLFEESKDSNQFISGVSAEQTHQNPLV